MQNSIDLSPIKYAIDFNLFGLMFASKTYVFTIYIDIKQKDVSGCKDYRSMSFHKVKFVFIT